MPLPKVVICSAVRTPIASMAGTLSALQTRDLATLAFSAAIPAAKIDPKLIEYTTVGWVIQDPRSPNIAKTVAELSGVPFTSPGTTLNEACASGGAAIHDVARRLQTGEISVGMAGGVESMSNVPRYMYQGRLKNQTYGDIKLVDGLMATLKDDLVGEKGEIMGLCMERLVEKYKVPRELQDEIAFASHANALDCWERKLFHNNDYVIKIELPDKSGKKKGTGETKIFSKDESPKKLPMEFFTKQQPYFKKGGTITSGNASSLNDGASAVVMATEQRAKELGLPILAELRTCTNVGVQREFVGEGTFFVIPALLNRAQMKFSEIDYFELNEAMACVVGAAFIAMPELAAVRHNVNAWGSGVGLGHPVGSTACRQVVDMVHQLRERGKHAGITSRCAATGIGSGELVVNAE